MLSLHKLFMLGNAQASLVLRSRNHSFLGLDAERGDQRGELLDVNHNLLRWLQRKSKMMTSPTKRHDIGQNVVHEISLVLSLQFYRRRDKQCIADVLIMSESTNHS